VTSVAAPADPDAARLAELGYPQELSRRLRLRDNVALGFATISPVVGLYGVALVGTIVAGPAWVWVLPVALAGQCLLLAVYAELASEFPIAGGAYQWSRRLMGGAYGWMSGWVAICAYAVANTTIAYLGAPWALTLVGVEPTANAVVATGMVLVLICAVVGGLGVDVLGRAMRLARRKPPPVIERQVSIQHQHHHSPRRPYDKPSGIGHGESIAVEQFLRERPERVGRVVGDLQAGDV